MANLKLNAEDRKVLAQALTMFIDHKHRRIRAIHDSTALLPEEKAERKAAEQPTIDRAIGLRHCIERGF